MHRSRTSNNRTSNANILSPMSRKNETIVWQAATETTKPTTRSPSAFCQHAKKVLELEMDALRARLQLLDELSTMTDEETTACLFRLLDTNRDGSLSVAELADGLRRIHGAMGVEESLALATERVRTFGDNARLLPDDFGAYLAGLSQARGTTLGDLAEVLVLAVVLGGNDDAEAMTGPTAPQEEEALGDNDRTRVLFHLFDLDRDGVVRFAAMVECLFRLADALEDPVARAKVFGLWASDETEAATLTYRDFTRFLAKLVAATGLTLDEVVLRLTQAAVEEIYTTIPKKETT